MITLIAESKTMQEMEQEISPQLYEANVPVGEATADEVMRYVAKLSVDDIAAAIKISPTLAAKITRMTYEFPNKHTGLRAIEAYAGVVFKALSYDTLTAEYKIKLNEKVRLISSLYGWLRPVDIIKPYRFDFTTRLAPGDRTFSEYWRKDVTTQLVKHLQYTGESVILNLLPADAAKCIDWKLVKRFAKVWKVDFKELKDGGEFKTPHAGKLKEMRGALLRTIITTGIDCPAELLTLETDSFMPLGTRDYPDHIVFAI